MNKRLFPTLVLSAALLTAGCTNPDGSINAGGTAFLVGAAALLGAAALSGIISSAMTVTAIVTITISANAARQAGRIAASIAVFTTIKSAATPGINVNPLKAKKAFLFEKEAKTFIKF